MLDDACTCSYPTELNSICTAAELDTVTDIISSYCLRNEHKEGLQDSDKYWFSFNKLCGRSLQHAPAPCKLTFDILTLKVVSESRVTWATCANFSLSMASLFST